jgi:hypothetical protein
MSIMFPLSNPRTRLRQWRETDAVHDIEEDVRKSIETAAETAARDGEHKVHKFNETSRRSSNLK